MILVISPSKTQNFDNSNFKKYSLADNLDKTKELLNILKKLSANDIAKLMNVSDKLALLNYERYQKFTKNFDLNNSKQALFAFKGDVYSGIDIDSYTEDDFEFAQNNIRILSGLYGVLRPLDLIQAYRLEMGTKLKNKVGDNLYKFWGNNISKTINKYETDTLINLASAEYFKAIDKESLNADIINISFKENKNGKYKTIGIYAKKARGLMVDFVIKNKITNSDKLKTFANANYKFSSDMSNTNNLVFIR